MIAIIAVFFLRKPQIIQNAKNLAETNAAFTSSSKVFSTNTALATTSSVIIAPKSNLIQYDREKTNAIQQYMESLNKPIDFFGQIIDQDGNPVSGVKVKVKIRHIKVIVPAAWGDEDQIIPIEKETDLGGRFEIHDVAGVNGFDVESIQKAGYQLSPKAANHFSSSSGSLENPVIIKMWKMGEKAQLINGNKFWGIIPDYRTYTMDFLTQTKSDGNNVSGDIRVRIIRPAQVKPRERFDWSFEIEGIQGGIIQTQDDFMYQAPEAGYQPKYEFSMSTNNPNWKREMDGMQFYLQSRNGNVCGRFAVDVIPDYNEQSVFNVTFSVNPNGSRNLQP
jgi:hypothetical protein